MDVNRRAFCLPAIVDSYARSDGLHPAEQLIVARYRDRIAGQAVLDLGCGAGRTTRALATLAARYDGGDIAEPMVARCRARFADLAHARFHVVNAAAMPGFADASYDFILFSFNGIDYLTPDGRLDALREIRRLLRPDGVFAFSTHNRRFASLVRRPRPPRSLHPRRWLTYLRNLANSLVRRPLEVSGADYEIVNEEADGFRLLAYYATVDVTAAQLHATGFRVLDVLDGEGRPIASAGDHPDVPFLHFIAAPA